MYSSDSSYPRLLLIGKFMANDYKITIGDTELDMSSVTNSVSVYNVYVNVVRDTKVNSSTGIEIEPVNIVTNLHCHIEWLSGRERVLFNKQTHVLDAILHCRKIAGVTIKVTDKIYYNSKYYTIVDTVDVNNLGVLLEIAIRKVDIT